MSPSLSIVVCTYNRSACLEVVLESLCRQTAAEEDYEIIVVDNNSADDTGLVARRFEDRLPNLRYCLETAQGLSRARNRGWQEAQGVYVGYIDDDAKAPEHWVAAAFGTIEKISPDVFGGPYYAFYDSRPPAWWKDEYRSCEHAERARPMGETEFVSGGNMFVRRDVIEQVGGFDIRFGMNGATIAYGEETVLQRRIRDTLSNPVIYYDPLLYIYHLVSRDKMTLNGQFARQFAGGRSSYRRRNGNGRAGRAELALQASGLTRDLLLDVGRAFFSRDAGRYPYPQNYLFEHFSDHLFRMGYLYERWLDERDSR